MSILQLTIYHDMITRNEHATESRFLTVAQYNTTRTPQINLFGEFIALDQTRNWNCASPKQREFMVSCLTNECRGRARKLLLRKEIHLMLSPLGGHTAFQQMQTSCASEGHNGGRWQRNSTNSGRRKQPLTESGRGMTFRNKDMCLYQILDKRSLQNVLVYSM